MTYDIGDMVRLGALFRARDGGGLDPTVVALTIQAPDGTSSTPTPVSSGAGVFFHHFTITMAGRWRFRWTGTGAVVASEEGSFDVRRRAVP